MSTKLPSVQSDWHCVPALCTGCSRLTVTPLASAHCTNAIIHARPQARLSTRLAASPLHVDALLIAMVASWRRAPSCCCYWHSIGQTSPQHRLSASSRAIFAAQLSGSVRWCERTLFDGLFANYAEHDCQYILHISMTRQYRVHEGKFHHLLTSAAISTVPTVRLSLLVNSKPRCARLHGKTTVQNKYKLVGSTAADANNMWPGVR